MEALGIDVTMIARQEKMNTGSDIVNGTNKVVQIITY